MKNKNSSIMLKVANIVQWILGAILITFFGVFVYTPEYNGISGDASKKGIKVFLDNIININISRLMLGIIIVIILLVLTKIFIEIEKNSIDQKSKILGLKNEKNELAARLSNTVSKNIENDKKTRIVEKMKILESNYPDIISVQIYECLTAKKKETFEYEIRPTQYYHTKAGDVVNLVHERYKISEKSLNEYRKHRELFYKGKYDELESYIQKLTMRLSGKYSRNPNNITEAIINDYALLTLALQLDFDDLHFKINSINADYQKKINEAKRTGFLRGLIEEEFYKFIHIGNSIKKDRIYITRCLDIEGLPHIFVIVLQPEIIKDNYFNEITNEIGDSFYNMLENELDLGYNKNTG